MPDVKDMWELLWDIYEKTKGTSWETIFPLVVIAAIVFLVIRFVIIPLVKYLIRLYKYITTNWFIKKKVYEGLSFMDSNDVYYAINHFVPTRFSTIDPSNNDEPAPEYIVGSNGARGREKDPLLIEHFTKYEYSLKDGKKYYLCLGDCGMGKTTFLINLYYQTLKARKYKCVFVPLQEDDCISRITKIEDKANTILLLDALDENDSAVANYTEFANKLERATKNFYRVIITARTNFFENEISERITNNKNGGSVSSKLLSASKFYITPFTDEDIKKYLKKKYHFGNKKMKQAWEVIEQNKNLSVRPLLLKFMDEIIVENRKFTYDFELYEFLFEKWIERERRSIDEELGKALYDECLDLAKQIYYNWMKNGSIGIYPEESNMSGIKAIKLKGHAMLNRTSDGMYKFSHKSYWEFLLAKLAISDVKFSDELYIKNFDRANEFLCEMISYNKLYNIDSDINIMLCEASYTLKYESPAEAEKKYRTVADNSTYGSWMYIIAMTKLAESLLRQLKETSAKNTIYEVYEVINNLEFDREHLYEFSAFAKVFSQISRVHRVADGQKYLEKLLFCYKQYHIVNYDLLRCYNEYCRCCINYKLKQEAISDLEELINNNYEYDQYAEYILLEARLWKLSYSESGIRNRIREIIHKYTRFMDTYELLVEYCDMAVTEYAYCYDNSLTGVDKNAAYYYFEQAYSLCAEIYSYNDTKPMKFGQVLYEDNNLDILDSPYMVYIQTKLFQAVAHYTDSINSVEVAAPIFKYIETNKLEKELIITSIKLYVNMGEAYSVGFEKCKEYLSKALELSLSINNIYYIGYSYEQFYWLCDFYDMYDESVEYLRKAYEVISNDEDLCNTPKSCTVMQLMLENTSDNDTTMARQLLETARRVYGLDKRKKNKYILLRDYYAGTDDKCIIEIDTELLKCELSFRNLEKLFESCMRNGDKEAFGVIVNSVIIENGSLSETERLDIEAFLKKKEQELDTDVVKFLKITIAKLSRSSRRNSQEYSYDYENLYEYTDKEISNRTRYEHSLGMVRLSAYLNDIVDKEAEDEKRKKEELSEIQKELEKKFEELFGSLDD